MVKCRIRHTKERKKISRETKFSWRYLKGMKQVEFKAHCPPEAQMESKILDSFSLGKYLMGAGEGSTFRSVCHHVSPCSSSADKTLVQKVWGCFNRYPEVFTRALTCLLLATLSYAIFYSHSLRNCMMAWLQKLWMCQRTVEKGRWRRPLRSGFFLLPLPECQGEKSKSFKQGAHLHSTAAM